MVGGGDRDLVEHCRMVSVLQKVLLVLELELLVRRMCMCEIKWPCENIRLHWQGGLEIKRHVMPCCLGYCMDTLLMSRRLSLLHLQVVGVFEQIISTAAAS
jgi:hypothetical protein